MTLARALITVGTGLVVSAALYGCAAFPTMQVADPGAQTGRPETGSNGALEGPGLAPPPGRGGRGGRGGEADLLRGVPSVAQTIPGAAVSRPQTPEAAPDALAALVPDEPIMAVLPPQGVGQFLDIVFSQVLKIPYALGPGISTRTDVIQLNQPQTTSKKVYIRSLQTTLRNYGLRMAVDATGRVQITEQGVTSAGGSANTIIRTRSSADIPAGPQRINVEFQLVALRADGIQAFLDQTFSSQQVTFTADDAANAFIIQGPARNVSLAVEFLQHLDVPAFAGAQVVRLQPIFYSPDNFAQALTTAMSAEGYIIGTDPLGPKSIVVVPLATTNQTLVFAADKDTMARVQYYATFLDQPSQIGDASGTYVYDVRNTSATSIGSMVTSAGAQANAAAGGRGGGFNGQAAAALGQPGGAAAQAGRGGGAANNNAGRGGAAAGGAAGGRGGAAANGGRGGAAANGGRGGQINAGAGNGAVGRGVTVAGSVPTGGTITVDDSSNRILFTGSPSQYASLRPLLASLDQPPREVLVEVTVAEVTLSDTTEYGLEWFFNHNLVRGSTVTGSISGGTQTRVPGATTRTTTGTGAAQVITEVTAPDTFLSSLGLGSQGLNAVYQNGDLRAAFNAFASNNKINILSRPRVTARSGAAAALQVGSSVPIVTAQQTADTGSGTPTVTNSYTYRDVGIILNITPTVYGDNRVDIQVYQDVSSVRDNTNPDIDSPFIDTRNVTTTLSLTDGRTAVLGGAIQDSYGKGNFGIPFLKDIPILGQLFRVDTTSGTKTELVVLITPFIIRDEDDMSDLTRQISNEFNQAFKVGRGGSYTLTPFTGKNVLAPGAPSTTITGANLQRPAPAAK